MSAINVEEILRSQKASGKRKNNELFADGEVVKDKQVKFQNDHEDVPNLSNQELLLKALDEVDIQPLDETSAKKLIAQFQKRLLQNQELRIKHPDDPEKFMNAEIELHVAIQELHAIASMPQLYYLLHEMNVVEHLLQLLSHENTDISVAVIDLLQELTDVETLYESEESAETLINALQEGQLLGLLVQNLHRLDETKSREEADGVHNILGVLENMAEFKPSICASAVNGLLQWLLGRLHAKMPFDGNKLYASEILAILLQNSEECRRLTGEVDGIDILLQQLAAYKRKNPDSEAEIEMMENLFNSLCASLLYVPNRAKFLKGEGLQLMNLMLREKKQSRSSALKVLDYATSGREGRENCDKLVDILGLRTLFPLFMKTPAKTQRKGHTADEHEEHICSIIGSLLKNCGAAQKQRVISKFVEQDYVKVERLMELHFKYLKKLEKFEQENAGKSKSSEDFDEDEVYMQKMDAGLFTLQIVDYMIAEVCVHGPSSVKEHVIRVLNLRDGSLKQIKQILREYATNLGSRDSENGLQDGVSRDDQNAVLYLVEKL